MRCCVPYCNSQTKSTTSKDTKRKIVTGKKYKFHPFPSDPYLREIWKDHLLIRTEIKSSHYVCSLHFRKEDYMVYRVKDSMIFTRLMPNAIPEQIDLAREIKREIPSPTPADSIPEQLSRHFYDHDNPFNVPMDVEIKTEEEESQEKIEIQQTNEFDPLDEISNIPQFHIQACTQEVQKKNYCNPAPHCPESSVVYDIKPESPCTDDKNEIFEIQANDDKELPPRELVSQTTQTYPVELSYPQDFFNMFKPKLQDSGTQTRYNYEMQLDTIRTEALAKARLKILEQQKVRIKELESENRKLQLQVTKLQKFSDSYSSMTHIGQSLLRWKTSLSHSEHVKKFALGLHGISKKAYEYVRKELGDSLPDEVMVDMWKREGRTKGRTETSSEENRIVEYEIIFEEEPAPTFIDEKLEYEENVVVDESIKEEWLDIKDENEEDCYEFG